MICTIACNDTNENQTIILSIDAISPNARNNIVGAIKAACFEYTNTLNDKTRSSFNWGDFCTYIPEETCLNHGFRVIGSYIAGITVDHDEVLVEA